MKIKSVLAAIAIVACGSVSAQNLDKYKNKFLDTLASDLGTTREFMVQDLKMEIDNMSLSHFLVEDSIELLTQIYNEDVAEQNKIISAYEKGIKEAESNNTSGKNELTRGALEMAKRHSINEFQGAIKEAKTKIGDLTKTYNAALEYYKDKDAKRIIYDVFSFRLIMVNPLKGIREVIEGDSFFTPGGGNVLSENTSKLEEYFKKKKNKD